MTSQHTGYSISLLRRNRIRDLDFRDKPVIPERETVQQDYSSLLPCKCEPDPMPEWAYQNQSSRPSFIQCGKCGVRVELNSGEPQSVPTDGQ